MKQQEQGHWYDTTSRRQGGPREQTSWSVDLGVQRWTVYSEHLYWRDDPHWHWLCSDGRSGQLGRVPEFTPREARAALLDKAHEHAASVIAAIEVAREA